jgi:hypothetical protein
MCGKHLLLQLLVPLLVPLSPPVHLLLRLNWVPENPGHCLLLGTGGLLVRPTRLLCQLLLLPLRQERLPEMPGTLLQQQQQLLLLLLGTGMLLVRPTHLLLLLLGMGRFPGRPTPLLHQLLRLLRATK